MRYELLLLLAVASPPVSRLHRIQDPAPAPAAEPAPEQAARDAALRAAGRNAGLEFTDAELSQLRAAVADDQVTFARLRAAALPNDLPPAFAFEPLLPGIAVRAPRLA